jgi:hypothetical protein
MRMPSALFAPSCVLLLAVVVTAPIASAQDIFVTPIPNVPFSGVVNIERSHLSRDGTIVKFKTVREIGRDTRGRIHNESRMLVPVTDDRTPQLLRIHIYDPQTRISTNLDPQERTFWTQTVNHPPSTQPPALRFASPAGGSPQNEFTKEEDLGTQDMEGVPARGVRETQIIPAENSGTGKEVIVTDEYWYSEDLRINLLIKHNDPRKEIVTMTVQVTLSEPDVSFFEIPKGYKQVGEGRVRK